jgi:hypothetical protein
MTLQKYLQMQTGLPSSALTTQLHKIKSPHTVHVNADITDVVLIEIEVKLSKALRQQK